MKKVLWIAAAVLLVAVLAALGGYFASFRPGTAECSSDAVPVPGAGGDIRVGEPFRLEFDAVMPLRCRIGTVAAELGGKAVVSGAPSARPIGYYWNRMRYRVSLVCIPLEAGMTGEGELLLALRPDVGGAPSKIGVAPFEILPAKAADTLVLAGALEKTGHSPTAGFYLWGIGALVFLTLAAAILYAKNSGRTAPAPSLQARTLTALAELRLDLGGRRITPAQAFARLTDLVRWYLEKRFGVPASRCTTEEFFERIVRRNDVIPAGEQPFLSAFLTAAELVKFARAEPDDELLHQALERAERLVERTTETEGEGK